MLAGIDTRYISRYDRQSVNVAVCRGTSEPRCHFAIFPTAPSRLLSVPRAPYFSAKFVRGFRIQCWVKAAPPPIARELPRTSSRENMILRRLMHIPFHTQARASLWKIRVWTVRDRVPGLTRVARSSNDGGGKSNRNSTL